MDERFFHSKGFVFSVDALLSIIVLTLLLASTSFFSARAYPEGFSLTNLQVKSNDVLVVLDKLDYFSGKNATAISAFVNSTIEQNILWHMEIEYYNFTVVSGGPNGYSVSFSLDDAIYIGDTAVSDDISSTTRVFVVANSTSVINYGRVSLKTWLK